METRRKPYALSYIKGQFCRSGWRVLKEGGGWLHLYADSRSLADPGAVAPACVTNNLCLSVQEGSFQAKLSIRGAGVLNLHLDLYESLRSASAFARVNQQASALMDVSWRLWNNRDGFLSIRPTEK